MIGIVDYGAGNIFSVQNMLKKIGAKNALAATPGAIADADKLILPGVGAFDTCMEKLQSSGLLTTLNEQVLLYKKPVLGICVGMQLMTTGSEEGSLPGLGWIGGSTVKFDRAELPENCKVPHMGWASVNIEKTSRLLDNMFAEPRFYFVHSYYVRTARAIDILATAEHGFRFTAAIEVNNIAGVQFHPEKSHKHGMKLLENFVKKY
jgi:glutamine amidotransferase